MFEHACKLGLEGIVSKRRHSPYQQSHSRTWLKIKNHESPAMMRIEDGTFSRDNLVKNELICTKVQ